MATWIPLKEVMDEQMKIPGFKERFEKNYAEFTKEMDAEIAAERAALLHVFPPKKNKRESKTNPFARKGRVTTV